MSVLYTRYFSALGDYQSNSPIDDRDIDGEFNSIVTALNRKVLCSGSAPSTPISGQTWVDTTNKILKVYRNNEWVGISAVHVSGTAMSTPQEGDLWYDTANNLLKGYDGSGWSGVANFAAPGPIGTSSASSGKFTDLEATTSFKLGTAHQGDVIYDNGTSLVRLPPGTSGYVLKTFGTSANPAWAATDVLSNVIFCWNGAIGSDNNTSFVVGAAVTLNDLFGGGTRGYSYWATKSDAYQTILTSKFRKVAGTNTITIQGLLWTKGNITATLKVDIGGQNNTVTRTNSATPTWATSSDIDVSTLTNGTTYAITIQMKSSLSGDPNSGYCGGIILIAS